MFSSNIENQLKGLLRLLLKLHRVLFLVGLLKLELLPVLNLSYKQRVSLGYLVAVEAEINIKCGIFDQKSPKVTKSKGQKIPNCH